MLSSSKTQKQGHPIQQDKTDGESHHGVEQMQWHSQESLVAKKTIQIAEIRRQQREQPGVAI